MILSWMGSVCLRWDDFASGGISLSGWDQFVLGGMIFSRVGLVCLGWDQFVSGRLICLVRDQFVSGGISLSWVGSLSFLVSEMDPLINLNDVFFIPGRTHLSSYVNEP